MQRAGREGEMEGRFAVGKKEDAGIHGYELEKHGLNLKCRFSSRS